MTTVNTSSTTLVNVAENAEIRLVQILSESADSSSFISDCESCIAKAEASRLIKTVIQDAGAMEGFFSMDTEEECVSAFSLLAALLDKVDAEESAESETELAMKLADAVSSSSGDAHRRVSILCALYNLRSDYGEKCQLLARIVSLCDKSCPELLSDEETLAPIVDADNLVQMLDGWGVSVEEKRNLLKTVGNSMTGNKRQIYLLLLLETYNDSIDTLVKDTEVMTIAKDAVVGAISDPITLFNKQRGMLSWPGVVALKRDNGTLVSLLEIFQEGKLDDFKPFIAKNKDILKENKLDLSSCTRHMRLLSLCSLAVEHEEIPYSAIAETLDITLPQVESWVIAAVASGLLVAKMDQLQQVVMVERCAVRKFGLEQWKVLQSRLNSWKKNVKNVLEGLKQTRNQQA